MEEAPRSTYIAMFYDSYAYTYQGTGMIPFVAKTSANPHMQERTFIFEYDASTCTWTQEKTDTTIREFEDINGDILLRILNDVCKVDGTKICNNLKKCLFEKTN